MLSASLLVGSVGSDAAGDIAGAVGRNVQQSQRQLADVVLHGVHVPHLGLHELKLFLGGDSVLLVSSPHLGEIVLQYFIRLDQSWNDFVFVYKA